ncbi:MAG TPA: phage holin family protein [Solirubrobacteraceae bacterium]|nr:phage holin family protein [Solirubrobacteraceae bacterium]
MTEHDRSPTALTELSVPELMRQLSDQTATLVRQELELAKAELAVKGKRVGIGAGMFGAAGVFGLYALGAFTAAVILALSLAMTGWLAALIVTAIYGAVAGALALSGKSNVRRGVPPVPEQTVETVREDVEMAKQRVQEGRR